MPSSLVFPILRLLADGRFLSGEMLASHFGVTRATVWNAVQQAEELGVKIYSVRGKGYRLPQPMDFLDHERITAALGNCADQFSLEIHNCLDSTNSLLTRYAGEGAPSGTCVMAELQHGGRGRRGRTWHSGLGDGLTFSLLWRFGLGAAALSGLSLAVGVGLGRALHELGAQEVSLKWPNDVLYQHKKLAGVLIELQGEMLGPSAAIIGIGINVRLADDTVAAIGQPVTDLGRIVHKPINRSELLASLLRHLAQVLDEFERAGFTGLRDEWLSRHAYHDQPVRLLMPDGSSRDAIVTGVAEDGTLLADIGQGPQKFSSAEISLRRAA